MFSTRRIYDGVNEWIHYILFPSFFFVQIKHHRTHASISFMDIKDYC